MKKIWNITDDPRRKDIATRVIMVLGRSIRPGWYATVKDEELEGAHKLDKDIKEGLVFIGANPPAEYMKAKSKVHAVRPKGASAHGEATVEQPAPETKVEQVVDQAVDDMHDDGWKKKKKWKG